MQLNDILANAEDQEKGREFELADPFSGKPTGIKLRVAGPDSETQRKARLKMVDELAALSDEEGRPSADAREKVRVATLARCVLGWDIKEDGEPVPFNHANVLRLLHAAQWVQVQVDDFAGNRQAFRSDA